MNNRLVKGCEVFSLLLQRIFAALVPGFHARQSVQRVAVRSSSTHFKSMAPIIAVGLLSVFGSAAVLEAAELLVEPAELKLTDADQRVQLLVTVDGGERRRVDVTHTARLVSSNPNVVVIEAGRVRPVADGEARITIETVNPADANQTLKREIVVQVTGAGVEKPVNFINDIVPILSKTGCNAGGCHGKASGQNGFMLSLLGAEAKKDYDTLVNDARGRRIFPTAPDHSLLLLKAIGAVPHGGGERFSSNSFEYLMLRRWITQGTPWGSDKDPRVTRIEVSPKRRLVGSRVEQQLRIVAHYTDGSTQDVTRFTEYKAQQPDILAVNASGRVNTLGRTGEGTVMVRYMGQVDVARLTVPFGDRLPDEHYKGFASEGRIDELVLDKWKDLGIAPSPMADDATFLRRAQLDLLGVLPTSDEVRAYVADADVNKRAKLIDRLLERPEYADRWAMFWGDLLRNKRRNGDQAKHGSYAFDAWIRNAFATNMPYDQFVSAILTAQGNVSDNPPVVWYREVRNIEHLVNDSAQLFLGTRVNCANCHNHPYEAITQDDYWSYAGFFARLGKKDGEVSGEQAVFVRKDGEARQPRSGQVMNPQGLLAETKYEYERGEDPRQKLVEWIRQKDNPYFGKAIANRMWAQFMGVGLVESIDDMRVTNPPSNPALLDHLAKEFVDHGYDVKQMIRAIMASRVYALAAEPTEYNMADHQNYARYYPRRLSPNAMADAVDHATGSITKYNGFPRGTRAMQLPDESVNSDFLDVFGRSQRESACECETSTEPSLPQVLHMMNAHDLNRKVADGDGVIAQNLKSKQSDEQIVEELYLRALGRLPDSGERKDALAMVGAVSGEKPQDQERSRKANLEDLLWALLNTRAFMFNH